MEVVLLSFAFFLVTRAVNPGCECIVYEGKAEGTFLSPDFPTPYVDNINCLLYTFLARDDEIIQITFDNFDVQKIDNLDCIFGDFVKLFLHVESGSVNEYTRWTNVLCGSIEEIERTHYSSNSSLIFEFHTDWRHGNHSGFKGTYKFIKRNTFQVDGERVSGSECDYHFVSSQGRARHGRFYSPRYPSNYPKYSRCSYRFTGREGERVTVIFEKVSFRQGDSSCLHSPDDVVVHDGYDARTPVIGQLCNANTMVEIVSTGRELFVEFSSRSHDPGQGFEAAFAFHSASQDIPSTEPDKTVKAQEEEERETPHPTKSSVSVECNQRISSDGDKNGSISSPNFPNAYPANVHCTYNFTGRGKERVQLIFTHFDLFYASEENNNNCDGVDAVLVFININGKNERLDNFCGAKMPAQLMSNGPSLSVNFHTHQRQIQTQTTGFRAIYRFVTNFGISTGRQDAQSVCGFIYNSSESVNGTFVSPNYPGFYPRDTECHYFFYARPTERVRITFPYFDVEGVTPCTSITASDYVEFSNFKTVDRKIPRHCSMKKPSVIESEGDFFRVTFRSNDKFDGTGFQAFYQFKSSEDQYTIKRVQGSPDSGGTWFQCWPPVVLLSLLAFVFAREWK